MKGALTIYFPPGTYIFTKEITLYNNLFNAFATCAPTVAAVSAAIAKCDASHTHSISLGSYTEPVAPSCMKQAAAQPCNKGNKKMHYNDQEEYTLTETERQKQHLESRLNQANCEARSLLVKEFYLYDDTPPVDGEDLVKRVQEGKYVLEENTHYGNKRKDIKWRDPTKPADRPGFDAANEKLEALSQVTRDEIVILSPEKGLESLRNFQSATFH